MMQNFAPKKTMMQNVKKKKERMSFMETALYLMERPAIYYMITTKTNSYVVASTFVVIFATAARMDLNLEYLEEDIFKFIEKLGWMFWLERIGILLFQFYCATGSIFCACIAWLILLFTNSFVLMQSPISMLFPYYNSVNRKAAGLPKLEQGNHNLRQDQEARQKVDTASSHQAPAHACSDSKTVNYDSSNSLDHISNEGWEVIYPEDSKDTFDPKIPKPSNNNQDHIEFDNSKAVEEVYINRGPVCCKLMESSQDDIVPPPEEVISIRDPVCGKPIESSQDDIMPPLEEVLSTRDPVCCKPMESSQDDIMPPLEEVISTRDPICCMSIESSQDDTVPPLEEVISTCDPVGCNRIELSQDNTMPPFEEVISTCDLVCCKPIELCQDDVMPPLEEVLSTGDPVFCKPVELSQDDPVPPLPKGRPIPVWKPDPVSEKLRSKISNPKRQLITLLLEGRDEDIVVDRKQVREAIEYLLEQLLHAEGEAELFKALCNRYSSLNNNIPVEACYATEFDKEEDKKKKESNQSDEEQDREEERKKWQEEWNRLIAEIDTLKASEAELEQNAIALEQELQFLRNYYQDSMYYYNMSCRHHHPSPCPDLDVLHLEYHLRELRNKVENLNKELEYERRCSDYYKQQCYEYSNDKKFMKQAYQDMKEKYVDEKNQKDRLAQRLNVNWEKERDSETENEVLVKGLFGE